MCTAARWPIALELLKNVIQRKLQPDTGAENGGFSLKKWGLQPCSHGGFSFENEDLIMLTVEALNLEGNSSMITSKIEHADPSKKSFGRRSFLSDMADPCVM
jgi:hypothetical protein